MMIIVLLLCSIILFCLVIYFYKKSNDNIKLKKKEKALNLKILEYTSKGYINSLEGFDDLLQVRFKDEVEFNEIKGKSSFIVNKKYLSQSHFK